ncbi:Eco57I restriction-modification methylase domain-containing protein [Bacillus cereus]
MAIQGLTLKQSMAKSIQAIMPQEEDKALFESNLTIYLENLKAQPNESEEFQKNLLKDFLQKCLPKHFINTNKRTDLAIYNGNTSDSKVGVLFEVKSLSNKTEISTKERLNSKAFQEIVHYYLNERLINGNLEVKKCIITNGLGWYIIDSKEMEKHFVKNKDLISLYRKWSSDQLSSQKTDFLYKNVVSPAIEKAVENGIKIAHFDIRDALKQGETIQIKKNNLTQLYRFFTPENLLNKEIFTDSNKLNKGFYDELLYLMGLEEVKLNNHKIIQRLPEEKRHIGSFVENVIDRLQINDVPVEKQYDVAVQLTVIWVNRILFLKLLESQLVAFNNDEKYKFLTKEMLPTFDDLYYLFFGVLAKKTHQRTKEMQLKFPFVPYLNSSLFEESELELSLNGIGIDRLREHQIEYYSKTVLKNNNKKKKTGKVEFLSYLFEFLSAYDFSSSLKHNDKGKSNLINAAVLGLIFEKINGYSDGAFYTPGRITMYMSRNIVRKAVIQKINEVKGWKCKNIYDVQFQIDSLEKAKEVNQIINSIKICDPAVGSGHFLVSVLNELIAIKSELRVLLDSNDHSMNDIRCTVVNDELIIQDRNGDNFVYIRGNHDSERIQKAIFNEKKYLIENCLFGVDLNPNSANICRLRLWIELLKNSYYYFDEESNSHELTTLPNIDINIKVGNSLLHKFDIRDNFDKRFSDLKAYTQLVADYKKTNNKSKKKELTAQIQDIKTRFINSINTPEKNRLAKVHNDLAKAAQIDLFASAEDQLKQSQTLNELKQKLKNAELEYEKSKQNPLFKTGLEWRMEFPEILNEQGDFEGFDVIIANPPYIYSSDGNFSDAEKKYFEQKYKLNNYQANTFGLFLELSFNILRKNGYCSMIIPNTFLSIGQYDTLRKYIFNNMGEVVIINSHDKIFEDAVVDNCIVNLKTSSPKNVTLSELRGQEINEVNKVPYKEMLNNSVINISAFSKSNSTGISKILDKIVENSLEIHNNYGIVKDGLKAYEREKGNPPQPSDKEEFQLFKKNRTYFSNKREDESYRKFLDGSDLHRYKLTWSGQFLKYGDNLAAKRNPMIFEGERILIRRIPAKSIYAFMATKTDGEYIHEQSIETIYDLKAPVNFLLGVLNSKVESFWGLHRFDFLQRKIFPQMRLYQIQEFPIPNATKDEQNHLAILVEKLLALYEKSLSSKEDLEGIELLNKEIDEYVMDLYKLSEEEKEVVRAFTVE